MRYDFLVNTSCYYTFCKLTHSVHARSTLFKMLHVFSLCVVVEKSVARTIEVLRIASDTSPQPLAGGYISWSPFCSL